MEVDALHIFAKQFYLRLTEQDFTHCFIIILFRAWTGDYMEI